MRITVWLASAIAMTCLIILYLSAYLPVGQGLPRFLIAALVIGWATFWILHWIIAAPLERLVYWMRRARVGEATAIPFISRPLEALAEEASHMAQNLSEARAAAREEAELRHRSESVWTAERLKEHVKVKLQGRPLFVVAN